jgi:predicted RNase H-like HicB family nuclease
MLAYYALFEPDHQHGGFVATFPDLAHGATQGETLEEAIDMPGTSCDASSEN